MSRGFRLKRVLVRAEGIEPSRAVKLDGFSYRLRLSPPGRDDLKCAGEVCGLDYPFTISRNSRGLGAARLVSTPSGSGCLTNHDAGGGGRTRTELSLQRILSRLSVIVTI